MPRQTTLATFSGGPKDYVERVSSNIAVPKTKNTARKLALAGGGSFW
jgi:hypothetical protein